MLENGSYYGIFGLQAIELFEKDQEMWSCGKRYVVREELEVSKDCQLCLLLVDEGVNSQQRFQLPISVLLT